MLTIPKLAAYLLHLMILTVPPGAGQRANALETSAAQADRYAQIADAIATVALDPAEAPVAGGRLSTAALLLSVAYFESSWRKDVDVGIARGDGGKSCTIYQLNIGRGRTPEGWDCAELVGDREKATRAALAMIRRSALACRREKGREAILFVYASGKCDGDAIASAIGAHITVREVAAQRLERARRWLREHPLPKE